MISSTCTGQNRDDNARNGAANKRRAERILPLLCHNQIFHCSKAATLVIHTRPTAIREEAMFQPVVPKARPDQKRGRWYHVHVRRSGGVGLKSLLIQRLEGESASSVRTSSMKASRDLKALVKAFACSISLSTAVWLHLIVRVVEIMGATTR
jgi:hypothetical protein